MEIFQPFEHNGKVLRLATYKPKSAPRVAPAKASPLRAPGAGKFQIGQINLSAAKIAAGEKLTLTAQVSGKNIAYIYTEILLKDKKLNQFYGPVAREYIQADQNKESRGISHPDWEDTINLSVRLSPGLRLLTDGADSAFGFLIPEGYVNSNYQLDGLYTPADGTAPRRARISFDSSGKIKDILAFKEQGTKSTPHALTPKPSDTFAPFAQVFTEKDDKWKTETVLSTPLTFGDQPFRLEKESLIPGEYLAGILIQDMDGGFTRKYVPFIVGA